MVIAAAQEDLPDYGQKRRQAERQRSELDMRISAKRRGSALDPNQTG